MQKLSIIDTSDLEISNFDIPQEIKKAIKKKNVNKIINFCQVHSKAIDLNLPIEGQGQVHNKAIDLNLPIEGQVHSKAVQHSDNLKNNILKYLVATDNVPLLIEMISYGNDIRIENDILIKIAIIHNSYNIANFLLETGIEPNIHDNFAVKILSGSPHTKLLELFITFGADVNADNNYPIKYAILNQRKKNVLLLIKNGIDTNVLFGDPITIAIDNLNQEIIDILLSNMDLN